jgi:hypothetical protein
MASLEPGIHTLICQAVAGDFGSRTRRIRGFCFASTDTPKGRSRAFALYDAGLSLAAAIFWRSAHSLSLPANSDERFVILPVVRFAGINSGGKICRLSPAGEIIPAASRTGAPQAEESFSGDQNSIASRDRGSHSHTSPFWGDKHVDKPFGELRRNESMI